MVHRRKAQRLDELPGSASPEERFEDGDTLGERARRANELANYVGGEVGGLENLILGTTTKGRYLIPLFRSKIGVYKRLKGTETGSKLLLRLGIGIGL